MNITYIDISLFKNWKVLREMQSINSITYVFKNNENKKIIFKKPNNPTSIMENKLNYLCNKNNLPIIYPKHIITQNNQFYGYTINFFEENNFTTLENFTNKEKIEYLLKAKENLEILHENGIIHGNINPSNILATTNPIFCDLDDCIIKSLNLDMENPNYFYQNYLNRTKTIDENLDKYEFNIMTYCILNNIRSPHLIDHRIKNNNFGYFKDEDSIKIIKRLLTFQDDYQDDYLIDICNKK